MPFLTNVAKHGFVVIAVGATDGVRVVIVLTGKAVTAGQMRNGIVCKIETQIRYLERMQDVIGCTSEQARATNDLAVTRPLRQAGECGGGFGVGAPA